MTVSWSDYQRNQMKSFESLLFASQSVTVRSMLSSYRGAEEALSLDLFILMLHSVLMPNTVAAQPERDSNRLWMRTL